MAARKSKAFWERHTVAIEASGLTRAAYCRRHGLNYGTMYGWQRRLRGGEGTALQALVPVVVAPSAQSAALVEIRVGPQVTVSVPTSVDPSWLGRLLHVVSTC